VLPCRGHSGACCDNWPLLVGLAGLYVLAAERAPDLLTVTVESAPALIGCPACGVVAESLGRRVVRLVDAPCFSTPVVLSWRKRRYRCREDLCEMATFTEQEPDLARPRGLLTTRAASSPTGSPQPAPATRPPPQTDRSTPSPWPTPSGHACPKPRGVRPPQNSTVGPNGLVILSSR
jgi:hypothetical protein